MKFMKQPTWNKTNENKKIKPSQKQPLTQAVECANMWNHEVADTVIGQRVRHAAESRRPRRRADQILQD